MKDAVTADPEKLSGTSEEVRTLRNHKMSWLSKLSKRILLNVLGELFLSDSDYPTPL